ncbi:Isc10p PWA37_004932 [Arxiozyma heterogenica]|uniref:Uncharacterized protein n=1 Tax=Arxiozyma heterogenica TaxID=278026 RepID=A0AAN8A751_9SACH|nr:hypothetical protein RI543_004963 [Kazachstania heterogenica]
MQTVNLNLKTPIIKTLKPIYKGKPRLKDYSDKQKSNSNIQFIDENDELYDLYVHGLDEFNSLLMDESLSRIGQHSCFSNCLNTSNVEVFNEMNPSLSNIDDGHIQELSYIVEEESQERIFSSNNSFIIDLSMLHESSNSFGQNQFDCSPFRYVCNYENQLDQGGVINSIISNSIGDKMLMFPQELEYQELSKLISNMDKMMYYLFGKDKFNFFQLSKQRDQFYDFPFLSLMKPLVFPGYEIEYDNDNKNEDESYVESNKFNEDNEILIDYSSSEIRDELNDINHSEGLV